MKILIVEDHVLFREGLVSLLEKHHDFSIVGEAETAKDAIRKATESKPDLILMDIELPDGSGLEAVKTILDRLPETLIVILTIHETSNLLLEAIRAGARGFLLKNTPVNHLIASLKAIQRGEAAISRTLTTRLVDEVSRTGRDSQKDETVSSDLTLREMDVLRELASDASNKEISERLYISENTVRYHVHKILAKLNLNNRREAARFARRHGLARNLTFTEKPES
ncbi:MAG: response regulator transcription factor [Candidatus Methanosuratincola sp.]